MPAGMCDCIRTLQKFVRNYNIECAIVLWTTVHALGRGLKRNHVHKVTVSNFSGEVRQCLRRTRSAIANLHAVAKTFCVALTCTVAAPPMHSVITIDRVFLVEVQE